MLIILSTVLAITLPNSAASLQQTADTAGVPVTVTEVRDTDAIRWSEVARIGSSFGSMNESLSVVADLTIGSEGLEVYVLDRQDANVRVFGRDGQFLRRWGRVGEGPGEFQSPISISVARDTVLVADELRVHAFTLQGDYLSSVTPHPALAVSIPHSIDAHQDGWTLTMREASGARQFWRTYSFDMDEGISHHWRYERPRGDQFLSLLRWAPTSLPIEASTFLEATTPDYELVVRRAGQGIAAIHRFVVDRVPVTDEVEARFRGFLTRRCRNSIRRDVCLTQVDEQMDILLSTPLPAFRPVVGGLVTDGEREVMVRRADLDVDLLSDREGEVQRWDHVGFDGSFVGVSNFPSVFRPFVLRGDDLWGVVLDPYDVPFVVLLRRE